MTPRPSHSSASATLEALTSSRYALLRSYRRDGTPTDTPIWFQLDGTTLVFRTKRGPKTRRLAACDQVELTPCDHRGRVNGNGQRIVGRATILDGQAAELANQALQQRYGWQWNVMPLVKVPGVPNVHRTLPLREKLRRSTTKTLWADCAIVQINLN